MIQRWIRCSELNTNHPPDTRSLLREVAGLYSRFCKVGGARWDSNFLMTQQNDLPIYPSLMSPACWPYSFRIPSTAKLALASDCSLSPGPSISCSLSKLLAMSFWNPWVDLNLRRHLPHISFFQELPEDSFLPSWRLDSLCTCRYVYGLFLK